MVDVNGTCDERFRALEEQFRANLEQGLDKGASLAVTLHGESVVDLWGGTTDWGQTQPWTEDTLVRVFSTSKVMVMVTVLLVVDRGLLDLDAPIAEYWPEFARHGKGAVTCRQVLLHKSGLPGFGRTVTFLEVADYDNAIHLLEDAELWYEPGTVSCYHPFTFGHLLAEPIRRITGVPFDEFFHREFAEPLGAEFHFRLTSPDDSTRVAQLWPAAKEPDLPSEMGTRAMSEVVATTEWIDTKQLAAFSPASSGITNGRAMARVGAMLAQGGELDGRRYIRRSSIEDACREHSYQEDQVLGTMRLGLGFGLDSPEFPAPTPSTFHWGGYGGSFLTMDLESGISCGFAQNQLSIGDEFGDDPRLRAFWSILGDISRSLA
ncbi:MAG: serine hydrolase domain-containing protein [Acidimicrobiales bacterium]